jgi:hypothetical protein
MHSKLWLENLKGRDYLGGIDVDGRILLRSILNKVCGCGLDSCGSGQGSVASCYEHGKRRRIS